jgi:hypothetical protein
MNAPRKAKYCQYKGCGGVRAEWMPPKLQIVDNAQQTGDKSRFIDPMVLDE